MLAVGTAVGMRVREQGSEFMGVGVLVFSQSEGLTTKPGQGVEQADVTGGIAFGLALVKRAEDFGQPRRRCSSRRHRNRKEQIKDRK